MSALLVIFCLFGVHHTAVNVFPAISCTVCHEMTDSVNRWQTSWTAKNHPNCVECHFDNGFSGFVAFNKRLLEVIPIHLKKGSHASISLPKEPLLYEEGKDPGYYSIVPNYRCFQCHEVKNHQQRDMDRIHNLLIDDILDRPCKDCHNHQMRNGQRFYERILR